MKEMRLSSGFGRSYDPALMKRVKFVPRIAAVLVALSGSLLGADSTPEVTAVPEPSTWILGGLCGLIFLFWRRK